MGRRVDVVLGCPDLTYDVTQEILSELAEETKEIRYPENDAHLTSLVHLQIDLEATLKKYKKKLRMYKVDLSKLQWLIDQLRRIKPQDSEDELLYGHLAEDLERCLDRFRDFFR